MPVEVVHLAVQVLLTLSVRRDHTLQLGLQLRRALLRVGRLTPHLVDPVWCNE